MARTSLAKLHGPGRATFAEVGALLGVREMLKAGLLKDAKGRREAYSIGGAHLINMDQSCSVNQDCGSVGCIGGTMALILGLGDPSMYVYDRSHMRPFHTREAAFWGPLFFPPCQVDYAAIRPAQMLKAIDNFIRTGGRPLWEKVLTKKQLRGE